MTLAEAARLKVGDLVEVYHGGRWVPARVAEFPKGFRMSEGERRLRGGVFARVEMAGDVSLGSHEDDQGWEKWGGLYYSPRQVRYAARVAGKADALTMLAASDWLAERGFDEAAAALRGAFGSECGVRSQVRESVAMLSFEDWLGAVDAEIGEVTGLGSDKLPPIDGGEYEALLEEGHLRERYDAGWSPAEAADFVIRNATPIDEVDGPTDSELLRAIDPKAADAIEERFRKKDGGE
jgi:hypothetical protein